MGLRTVSENISRSRAVSRNTINIRQVSPSIAGNGVCKSLRVRVIDISGNPKITPE